MQQVVDREFNLKRSNTVLREKRGTRKPFPYLCNACAPIFPGYLVHSE